MSDIKWIRRELEQANQISRMEWDSIIRHCFWEQTAGELHAWFDDTPGDTLIIHIAGTEASPVVLELDADSPVRVMEGPSVHDFLELPDEHIEYTLVIAKNDAIRVLCEGASAPQGERAAMATTYLDVLRPRFCGTPFVYLTVLARKLPLKVPFDIAQAN